MAEAKKATSISHLSASTVTRSPILPFHEDSAWHRVHLLPPWPGLHHPPSQAQCESKPFIFQGSYPAAWRGVSAPLQQQPLVAKACVALLFASEISVTPGGGQEPDTPFVVVCYSVWLLIVFAQESSS